MFAGAAREAVFANPEVVQRIQRDFIPVALKAGLINNPPRGPEGDLYAEIGRSKPAPQGICVANSAGKVLDWVLMFDDDASVVEFLDHALRRFSLYPDASGPVPAERFMRFPSRQLPNTRDTTGPLTIPDRHADDRCPAKPALAPGTLVGRIIGRALRKDGQPVSDTLRQEHYMEARFELSPAAQRNFVAAVRRAGEERFRVPDSLARGLITHAYLGQLDVNPLGPQPGGKNDRRSWEFWAQRTEANGPSQLRVRIDGTSSVAGGADRVGVRTDGRRWKHEVNLNWQAYVDVDMESERVTRLIAVARGDEKLRWGNARGQIADQPDVAHLPAGHAIDLECGVVYGLSAEPCSADEIAEPAVDIRSKMQRLQGAIRRRVEAGRDVSEIGQLMKGFGPLMQQGKARDAEALLEEALKRIEEWESAEKE